MAKITYSNKVALNKESSIPAINKVTDDDMNSLKGGINDILTALGLDKDTWTSGTSYAVGTEVVHNGILYKCTTANTDTTFTTSKWSVIPILVDE